KWANSYDQSGNMSEKANRKQTTPGAEEEWSATFLVARRLGRIKKKGLSACMARRPKAPCGGWQAFNAVNPSLHLGCRRLNRTIRKNKLGRVLPLPFRAEA